MLTLTNLVGFNAGGEPPFAMSFLASYGPSPQQGTAWSQTVSFGAVPDSGQRRFIFACWHIQSGSNPAVYDTGTIDGGAPTIVANLRDGSSVSASVTLAYREVTTGTTGDMTLDPSHSCFMAMGVYRVITGPNGILVGTPGTASAAQALNMSVTDSPSRASGIIAMVTTRNAGQWTWSNAFSGANENYDFDLNSSDNASGAFKTYTTNPGSLTITATTDGSSAQWAGAAVSVASQL